MSMSRWVLPQESSAALPEAKSGHEKVASLWKVKSPITMTLSGGNGQKRFVSSHC